MKIEISSTNAARGFGDCLARIKYRGDTFVITRNNEAIAELVPAPNNRRATWSELESALNGLPHDPTFADDLERVNEADRTPSNPWD